MLLTPNRRAALVRGFGWETAGHAGGIGLNLDGTNVDGGYGDGENGKGGEELHCERATGRCVREKKRVTVSGHEVVREKALNLQVGWLSRSGWARAITLASSCVSRACFPHR